MNWVAIGVVGDIFGVIAVFVSLVYLAMQTKNNTKALRSAAFHQVRESFSEVSLAMVQDPGLALLVNRASSGDPSLTDEERLRYEFFLTTFLRRGESAYFQSAEGTLQMETWLGIKETIVISLRNDYGQAWFSSSSFRFTKDYVSVITQALNEVT